MNGSRMNGSRMSRLDVFGWHIPLATLGKLGLGTERKG
jgi:hypothetical protein